MRRFRETKRCQQKSKSEHLPNTASLEASFAAEAVLLSALGFLLTGKRRKKRVSLLQDSFRSLKVTQKTSLVKTRGLILYLGVVSGSCELGKALDFLPLLHEFG